VKIKRAAAMSFAFTSALARSKYARSEGAILTGDGDIHRRLNILVELFPSRGPQVDASLQLISDRPWLPVQKDPRLLPADHHADSALAPVEEMQKW